MIHATAALQPYIRSMENEIAVLEALLTGLPIIINRRSGLPVPELEGDFVYRVENSVFGYEMALRHLLSDDGARQELGQRAFAHAQQHWAPAIAEAKYAAIYRRTMRQTASHGA